MLLAGFWCFSQEKSTLNRLWSPQTIAPPGATFQINVRPPQSIVSGLSAFSSDLTHFYRDRKVWGPQLQRSGMLSRPCPNTPMDESEPIVGGVRRVEEISWLNFVIRHVFWTLFWAKILRKRSNSDPKIITEFTTGFGTLLRTGSALTCITLSRLLRKSHHSPGGARSPLL